MLTAIIAFLSQSWVGTIVSSILGWFTTQQQAQTDQNNSVNAELSQHDNDGAQSVTDKISDDAQNAALDKIASDLDNPAQVIVTPPKGS